MLPQYKVHHRVSAMHTRKISFCTYNFHWCIWEVHGASPECIQLTNHTGKTLSNGPCHNILVKIKDKEPIIRFFYSDFIEQITVISRNAKKQSFLYASYCISYYFCLSVCISKHFIALHSFRSWSVHGLKEKSGPCSAQSSCSDYLKILMNKL